MDAAAPAGGDAPTTRHLGLDLGATNLKWAVVAHGPSGWSTVARDQAPTRLDGVAERLPDRIIAQLADVAHAAAEAWGPVASVGVAVPGTYDPATGTATMLVNLPGPWAGRPIAAPIAAVVAAPTALVNDARAFGLAEVRLGAGAAPGVRSLVGLTLGTGVGGVIVIDGRVVEGHDGSAGEIGHQTIDPDGPWCGCGNRGCVEAYARADQIAAACHAPSVEAAVRAAEAGDPRAIAGLAEVGRYLGIGIANVVTLLSPDLVVIGGGVAGAGELLFGPIRAELRRRVTMTPLRDVTLVPAGLGIWAGAIGAAIHGAERAGAPTEAVP